MRKNFKRFVAAFAAATVMTGAMPFTVFAANSYTELRGDATVKFRKDLVLDDDANIPAATFNYSITPGTHQNYGTGTLEVLAGLTETVEGVDYPNISTVTYTANEAASEDMTITNRPDAYKLATKYATIDFSGIKFKEPGVYRYIITETGIPENQGITNDVDGTTLVSKAAAGVRTLDVYVGNDDTDSDSPYTLQIENYVLYEGIVEDAPQAGDVDDGKALDGTEKLDGDAIDMDTEVQDGVAGATKSEGYINSYDTSNITFDKTVTGNQGSKDKYFKFKITVTGDFDDNQIFDIDTTNSDYDKEPAQTTATKYTAEEMKLQNNVTSVTGAQLRAGKVFYLQHGQNIKINGIPAGASYTITEVPEDYTPAATVSGDTLKADGTTNVEFDSATNAVTDDGLTADTVVAFTNDRSGILPTGILMSVGPVAVVGVGILAAIFALFIGSKKRELEEE